MNGTSGNSTNYSSRPTQYVGLPQFLSSLYGNAGNAILNLWAKQTRQTHSFPVGDIAAIAEKLEELRNTCDLYFEICLQDQPPEQGKRGNEDSKTIMTTLWFDLDVTSPFRSSTRYPKTMEEAVAFAEALNPSIIVGSGYGLQLYHLLEHPLHMSTQAERQRAKAILQSYQRAIIELGRQKGWEFDFTGDLARIFRLPETYNHKGKVPQPVSVIYYNQDYVYDVSVFERLPENTKDGQEDGAPQTQATAQKDYPSASVENIEKNCAWVRHCHEDAASLSEPSWFAVLSILARCENGAGIAHAWSKPYPKYTRRETDDKLKNVLKANPRTCENIRTALDGQSYCNECPFWSRITSPIQLGNVVGQDKLEAARLLHDAVKNPSILYNEDSIKLLARLSKQDKSTFFMVREGLKHKNISVKRLDTEIRTYQLKHADDSDVGFAQYLELDGCLTYMKPTNSGDVPVRLCNFIVRLVEEVIKDDGRDTIIFYGIQGTLKSGQPLPPVEVSSVNFPSMNWIPQRWGSSAVIAAGQATRDHMRCGIQLLSGEVPKKYVYGHTGWRQIDGEWFYLSASGGIGKDGLATNIEVDLGDKLSDYAIPGIPASLDTRQAIAASMEMLDVAPDKTAVPLFGSVYTSTLGEMLQSDFSLLITGPTGCKKSELGGVQMAHFGQNFHGKNLPANWVSTGNAIEKQAFLIKDGIIVVDDFLPKGSQGDVARMHQLAERVLRGQGNKSGRNRMNADGSIRQTYYPRGLIVATGEDVPKGQSLRGRMLICEVGQNDVRLPVLTRLQSYARGGMLVYAMSAFLQWLVVRVDAFKNTLPHRKMQLRNLAAATVSAHARTADTIAILMCGIEVFIQFALEYQILDVREGEELWDRCWKSLLASDELQKELQATEDPVIRFVELLTAAFTAGTAYLEDTSGGIPVKDPQKWGWRDENAGNSTAGGALWKPKGNCVGWINGLNIYLNPDAAYAVAQQMALKQGANIPLTQRALQKMLNEKNYLATTDTNVLTVQKQVCGSKKRVLHMLADKFEDKAPSGNVKTADEVEDSGSIDPELAATVDVVWDNVPF